MKIIITCDEILRRVSPVTDMVEMFSGLYPEAQIYTLAHNPKKTLGPLSHVRVRSSYLSNMIKSFADFKKWGFLIPSAASALNTPCDADLIINISSGFSHGIKKCKCPKQITYLYDMNPLAELSSFQLKFFKSYLEKWALKKLRNSDKIICSSESLKNKVMKYSGRSDVDVLVPFVKLDDYKIISSPIFKYDYTVILAEGLTVSSAIFLTKYFQQKGEKFVFVGKDTHLDSIKDQFEEKAFFGDRCSGELAPLLAGSKIVVEFGSENIFPSILLKALATGRPVATDSLKSMEYLPSKGVTFIESKKYESLDQLYHLINSFSDKTDQLKSKELRAQTMKYHPAAFRGKMIKNLEKLTH